MREVEVMSRERERGRRREARRRARAPSFAQRAGPLPLCQTRARRDREVTPSSPSPFAHTHGVTRIRRSTHTQSPLSSARLSAACTFPPHEVSLGLHAPSQGSLAPRGACGNKYTETDRQTQKRHAAMRSVETRHASPTHTPPKRMRAHSPAPSSRPRAMLRFCTAAPLAPLPRLSSRTATTHVWRSALS